MANIRILAFDLDGTLTQHKSPLGEKNRAVLERAAKKYKLLMVGAGGCQRIFKQMGGFPIDIIGNYGMQYAEYDAASGDLVLRWDEHVAADAAEAIRRAGVLRERYSLTPYAGETIEIHPTGLLTFPVLGTQAALPDKLAYDPDRSKRRAMYAFVRELFHDYSVVIGGSSSFDIVPGEYGKCNALRRYMRERGIAQEEVVYCGDDYNEGGNDHDVLAGGIPFVKVDDYEKIGELLEKQGII